MKEQQDVVFIEISKQMAKLNHSILFDEIFMDIISKLKERSHNLKGLRENYARFQAEITVFFEEMNQLLYGKANDQ